MEEQQVIIDRDKDLSLRLFTYLRELVRLRENVVRDINSYDEVLWLNQVPKAPGWHSSHWQGQEERFDDVWLEIKKPKIPQCPTPPSECEGWYFKGDLTNSNEIPSLQKIRHVTIKNKNGKSETEIQTLSEFPDIAKRWDCYLEKEWLPWMEEFEKVRPIQEIYSKLFRMFQLSNKLGESYETVLGLGFLVWNTKKNQEIKRHIITAQTRIEFDSNTGGILIKAGSDGAKMVFENDMLDPSELPPHDELQVIEASLNENPEDPWDTSIIYSVIRSWIHALKSDGTFSDSAEPPKMTTDIPQCNFAPAIILRKRNQRGWIKVFNKIISKLEVLKTIPPNTKMLINLSEDGRSKKDGREGGLDPVPDESGPSRGEEDEHVLFPLPTNKEQLEILQRLSGSKGVRVQGPPGTGKSHSIANIICHYLATGRSLLVTAYAPRALKVLQNDIPNELSGLCVTLLGHDAESIENLKSTVNEITEKFNDWDEAGNASEISSANKRLGSQKEELSKITKRVRELREEDTYELNEIPDYQGTVQQIAKIIKEKEGQFGWIQDHVEPEALPPLTNLDFSKLIKYFRDIGSEEIIELKKGIIPSSELLNPDKFLLLLKEESELKGELEAYKHYSNDHKFQSLLAVNIEKRQQALKAVTQLRFSIDEGLRRPHEWLKKAVYDMLGDQDQPLRRLHEVTKIRLEGLREKAQIIDDYQINLPPIDKAQMQADAQDFMNYLKSGKKIRSWPFQNKLVKRTKHLWEQTFIEGRKCDNIMSLEKLLEFLDVDKRINQLWRDWSGKASKVGGSFVAQEAAISEQLESLDSVLAIDTPLQNCKTIIHQLSIFAEPKWHQTVEVLELEKIFKASLAFETEKAIKREFSKIEEFIDHYVNLKDSHKINKNFKMALNQRDHELWTKSFHDLIELENRSKKLSEKEILLQNLKESTPELAESLSQSFSSEEWDNRKGSFEEAWRWSLADTYLQNYEANHDSEKLNSSYLTIQNKILETTKELCASMAWNHCFKTMTHLQRTALLAWKDAVRRIGSGKRKGSAEAQRDAEQHMRECRKTIPCWIMPLYRVLDTISMDEPEIFDLIIVDEASQCGPESLFLHFLGKKVIVAGDDEQVAPENVGVQVEDVLRLRKLYLDGVPLADSLGRDSTLFDNAGLRLRERVFLKEHFRCMPEIIQFCNDLSYAPQRKSLVPLRQYGPDRLEPPVKAIYVEGGYRDRSAKSEKLLKTNLPEAKQIVDSILGCHSNPDYKGKKFGVISMMGKEQAKLIEGMLMKVLTPKEYEDRKLLCGTPASFQGDEREIIFMSMVDALPSRLIALTKDTDKRRFNVGVSRAKDQIWLFHSFQESDLKKNCFRHRLLTYCRNPYRVFKEGNMEKCESQFEKDVYSDISHRKYRIVPQVEVAGKRIDLVVEGMRARLAVECDGDEWHGPEKWDEDMERKRTLERCGWNFWTVRGSEYYRDPDSALSSLWDKLEAMQIYPYGAEAMEEEKVSQNIEENLAEDELDDESENDEAFAKERGNEAEEGQTTLFEGSKQETRDLKPLIIQKIVKNLLSENSRGKDLLPTAVIRRAGLAIRGKTRNKLVLKINRVVNMMVREEEIEQYRTQKRVRFRLPS